MDTDKFRLYRNLSGGFILVAFILFLLVTFVSYIHQDRTSADPLIFWTVEHHLSITIALMFISLLVGYGISALTYNELRKSRKSQKGLLELLFLFLSKDEREILDYLVKNKCQANQAVISKLPGMNRVRAFRSLQKMKENNLIEIHSHGKIRKITLRQNVFEMLINPAEQ